MMKFNLLNRALLVLVWQPIVDENGQRIGTRIAWARRSESESIYSFREDITIAIANERLTNKDSKYAGDCNAITSKEIRKKCHELATLVEQSVQLERYIKLLRKIKRLSEICKRNEIAIYNITL